MDIRLDELNGIPVVRLSGDLTQEDENPLFLRVAELLEAGRTAAVLDLSNVPYISSGGLRDLVNLTARSNAAGNRLYLAAASPFVAGVIETTRLNRFFDMTATVDEAVSRARGA